MPRFQHGPARVWYRKQGDGPEVLLIHGGLFDPMDGDRFWRKPGVVSGLALNDYRVLVPDRRFGGGRTSAPFAVHTWDVEVADMLAVMDHAGAGPVHVVAGSNGCSVAIRLALATPERIRSLSLCWPGGADDGKLPALFERSADFIEKSGVYLYVSELRRLGIPHPYREPERPGFPFGVALLADQEATTSFLACSATAAAAILRESAKALFRGDAMRGLDVADLRVLAYSPFPVTVVPAEPTDVFHHFRDAELLVERIPGAKLGASFPVTPSPAFGARRLDFVDYLCDSIGRRRRAWRPAA